MCNYLTADTKMREFDGCELTHLLYQSGKEKARFASIKGGSECVVYFTSLSNIGVVWPATQVCCVSFCCSNTTILFSPFFKKHPGR